MPRPDLRSLVPAGLLALGWVLLMSAKRQEAVALAAPLERVLPKTLLGLPSRDQSISPEERRIAGMSNYLLRMYGADPNTTAFSLYVGYYEQQGQGRSIHSPKNCLPGAGWEPMSSGTRSLEVKGKRYQLNRYLLANGNQRVLVYYWYQGRGRVSWNEYSVKWELLRDKAVSGRSDEALVRIVVPIGDGETAADSLASKVAVEVIPRIFQGLPSFAGRDS